MFLNKQYWTFSTGVHVHASQLGLLPQGEQYVTSTHSRLAWLRATGDGTSTVTVWVVLELPGKAYFHHYQWPQSCLPWHHSSAAGPVLSCAILCSYLHVLQNCWHTRCILTQPFPAASVEKDALDVLAMSNKSGGSLWRVDMLLNSQALQWSKPKCFLPPRWT